MHKVLKEEPMKLVLQPKIISIKSRIHFLKALTEKERLQSEFQDLEPFRKKDNQRKRKREKKKGLASI
jgi:hypothetical protein